MSLGTSFRVALLSLTAIMLSLGATVRADDPAPAKPPAAEKTKVPDRTPGALLDRFARVVNELKLSDEQKTKIDALFDKAKEDARGIASDRDVKFRESFNKLKKDVAGALTTAQQLELRDKMQPGPGAAIDEIKRQLHKPAMNLSAEQLTKIDEVLDDTKKKLEDLKADAQKGGKNIDERFKAITKDMHDRLATILSPDQQKQINPGKDEAQKK